MLDRLGEQLAELKGFWAKLATNDDEAPNPAELRRASQAALGGEGGGRAEVASLLDCEVRAHLPEKQMAS
jgi:hypothetical protein